jgi:outer membrane protein assembly factor BamB
MELKPTWSFKLPNERRVHSRRPVVIGDRVLVSFHYDKAGFFQSTLCAFDVLTGDVVWTYVTDHIGNEPVALQGTTYWSSFEGVIHALDSQGQVIWRGPGCEANIGVPAVSGDRIVVAEIAGQARFTWCLDRASGETLWKFDNGGHAYPLTIADGRVFHGAAASTLMDEPSKCSLFSLSLEDGKAGWSVTDKRYFFNPVVSGARLYVCSSRSLQARDASTGKLLAELPLESQQSTLTLIAGADDTRLYVWRDGHGQGADAITAVDVSSSRRFFGEKVSLSVAWRREESRGLCEAPREVARHTLIYLTHDGVVNHLDAASGAPGKELRLKTKPCSFGGVAIADGRMFVTHGPHVLVYALGGAQP